jgi:hypothetical protein
LIWFGGVYGREEQFKSWLTHWAQHGLSNDSFLASQEALFSGKAGIAVTALRLQRNLLPLVMLLDAYQALADMTCPLSGDRASRHAAQLWLTQAVAQLWNQKTVFNELSRDASFSGGPSGDVLEVTRLMRKWWSYFVTFFRLGFTLVTQIGNRPVALRRGWSHSRRCDAEGVRENNA